MSADLVAITPYGRNAGSSRVRVFDWLARMHQIPTEVHSYVGAANAGPGELARQYRRVILAERELRQLVAHPPKRLLLHREASPFSRGRLERRLAGAAPMSVYDFDDALQWDVPRSLATRLFPKPAKCLAAVSSVDRVIAGNDTLADWASGHARDVVVIPSCVEPAAYEMKPHYALSDPPRLVWLGSPSTEKYLVALAPTLLRLHNKYGIRLTVISGPSGDLPQIGHLVDRVAWSASDFALHLATADIAIAPLSDAPYERGKCAYKILQYGAAGLPFVSSPVGANDLATNRLGGMAAANSDEWYDAVASLLTVSAETREKVGRTARAAVEESYSFAAWHPTWTAAVLEGEKCG